MNETAATPKAPSRFDPAGKSRKARFWLGLLTGLALVLSALGMGVMNLYFGTGRYKLDLLAFYFRDLELVLLNVLPFALLILLLWALTNRAWIAFLGTGVFTLIYSWAEYWKLMGRSDPIIAEDLTILSEGLQMGGSYITVTWQIVLSALLVLAGTLVFFFFLRGRLPRPLPRLGLAALVIAASWLLYTQVYTDYYRYKRYPTWEKLNKWVESQKFISRGCLYPFLYSTKELGEKPPEGYSAAEAEALLRSYPSDDIPPERRLNVIVVMYEAFADLSECTDRITAADPYAAYHRLQAESLHGRLVTNIFAAGTIDTERCVLTGFPLLTSFRRAGWSYARYFAEQGYAVNGSHPGYESFYNRRNVNRNLGLEPCYFLEDHYRALSPGGIAPDSLLLPEIVRLCREDLQRAGNVFSFNVTYQNHGPYPADAQRFSAPYVPAEGLDEAAWTIVNNYLWGVEDSGNQMLAMAEQLRQDESPWVLVFFGDHKPWLGDQNSVYTALGIDLDSGSEESFYNYYGTEYLIWANDAARAALTREGGEDPFSGRGPDISPCYLMNLLFEACGWAGPSWLKLSEEVRAMLPVVSTKDRCLENGALIAESELSEPGREALARLRRTAYYLMRDSGGALPAAE